MARNDFSVVAAHVDGEMVLRLRGDLDTASAPDFTFAATAFTSSGMRIVLDFEEVTFLDSAGLTVISSAASELSGHGGSLSIRNAPASIDRILQISGLTGYLTADGSPTEAA